MGQVKLGQFGLKIGLQVCQAVGGLSSPIRRAHINRMGPAVYLIGAGPGDPGLLTLRGAELLGRVDVVLYDGLSNPRLLGHAPQAEWVCVGKHGECPIWTQDQINAEMIRLVRAGKRIARLKGGDPAVFARTADEVEALRAEGISFEIVPGITAALAAGSYAGIPITHRRYASAVALVTGQEEPGKSQSALDWEALARFPGTLVIYMGVTTARQWSRALMEGGKPASTPVAILRRCSLPDQQTVFCQLDEVAELLTPATRYRPPVIVIVGEVTHLAAELSWFDNRPLFGKTVLVTRAEQQADELAAPLSELGAEVLVQPAISVSPPADWEELDRAIRSVAGYDWIVFTSRNGVRYFFERLSRLGFDARHLGNCRIAAVGKKTAEAIAGYRLHADFVADGMSGESLAAGLIRGAETPGAEGSGDPARRAAVLWVRASRGPDTVGQRLRDAGMRVTDVNAYRHEDIASADESLIAKLAAGEIDWVTVTSDAIAKSLDRLFGAGLARARLAALSPAIARTLEGLGLRVDALAIEPTMAGVVEAILAKEVEGSRKN